MWILSSSKNHHRYQLFFMSKLYVFLSCCSTNFDWHVYLLLFFLCFNRFYLLLSFLSRSLASSFYPYEDPSLRAGDRVALPSMTSYDMDNIVHMAKDIVVGKRKLENDLVRQGIYTDMSKRTAVTRHQAVTTTFNKANDLACQQDLFEEMTKLIARKWVILTPSSSSSFKTNCLVFYLCQRQMCLTLLICLLQLSPSFQQYVNLRPYGSSSNRIRLEICRIKLPRCKTSSWSVSRYATVSMWSLQEVQNCWWNLQQPV